MEHRCPHEDHANDPYHHACKDCKDQTCGGHHLALHVAKALEEDGGAFIARLSPANMEFLQLKEGDHLLVEGNSTAVVPIGPASPERGSEAVVHLDRLTMENAGTSLFEKVTAKRADAEPAVNVVIVPDTPLLLRPDRQALLEKQLEGMVVLRDNSITLSVSGDRPLSFTIVSTKPDGPVQIGTDTILEFGQKEQTHAGDMAFTYEDIGGLGKEIDRIREIVEFPLQFPEVFRRLGVEAPKGILLHGPPGSGKTLIARIVAQETHANFYHVNGPEIMRSHYGESEKRLRSIFEKAQENAPAIIFLDEIDAVAPRREKTEGEVEKRIVAQLLALMDGLESRGQVVVMGATNIPNALDPALRRPGRFDREINIGVPDQNGRLEILRIHSRGMPLAPDVDLDDWARRSHGFVGADLRAFCQEAAIHSLRRIKPELNSGERPVPQKFLESMYIHADDFEEAFKEVEPSAIREVRIELPQVGWNDIGGYEQAKERLQEAVIWPNRFPERFEKIGIEPPRGILITGPSGTGKTLLAQALAKESGFNFISVKGPELLSKYVGESEERIREIFRKARMAAPSILFFDEIDSIAGNRGHDNAASRVTSRMVSQLLTEMSGIETLRGVTILGATNLPELLDPSLLRPGRFELYVTLGLPDDHERKKIFGIHLDKKPTEPDLDVDWLVKQTNGWTGAQIEALCRGAALTWLHESIEGEFGDEQFVLTKHCFEKVLERMG